MNPKTKGDEPKRDEPDVGRNPFFSAAKMASTPAGSVDLPRGRDRER
jgi:hypothetical protein